MRAWPTQLALVASLATCPLVAAASNGGSEVAAGASASASTSAGEPPLDVQSDKLDLDMKAMRAVLEGHVRLIRGGMTLRCDRLELTYVGKVDAARIAHARGSGHLGLDVDGAHVEAPSIDYDVEGARVNVAGPVKVLRDGAIVLADRAEVDTKRERLALFGVKASVPIPSASTRP
jgi:lipopolysaccharide export system protein LptA